MAIPGKYYIVNNAKADRLNSGKTREPLNPANLTNLRRDKDNTMFIINSTEDLPASDYVTRFATRSEMINYINSQAQWVTADMTATRTEQDAVDFTQSITGIKTENLINAWIPKEIMWSGTTSVPKRHVSTAFLAGSNCDTATLNLRKWRDINKGLDADILGWVGGSASIAYRTELYNAASMFYNANPNKVNLNSEPIRPGDWTVLLGFQPFAERGSNVLLGDSANTKFQFVMNDLSNVSFNLLDRGRVTTKFTFPLSRNQIVNGSVTQQMYPIFIRYDHSENQLSIPQATRVGSTIYSISEYNTFVEAGGVSYPNDFLYEDGDGNVHNYRMYTNDARSQMYVGCYAVWDTLLSETEMATLDSYILSL